MSKNLSLQELLSTNLSPNIADEETLKSISDNVNKTYSDIVNHEKWKEYNKKHMSGEPEEPVVGVRYGIKIEKDNPDPYNRITYMYDAVGMTPARMDYTNGKFNYGSWGDAWFVKDNKPVMLNYDGTEAYELNPNDYSKKADGSSSDIANTSFGGNAMSRIPLVYVSMYEDSTYEYYSVSNIKYDDTYVAIAHTKEDGTIKDNVYLAMFQGSNISSKLRSISGTTNIYEKTADVEITYAKANGTGWYTRTWGQRMLINILLMIMSKNDNSQEAFGQGLTKTYDSSASPTYGMKTSGQLNDKGQFFGYNDETHAVKVFHIENWWGNQWERIAGLINDKGTLKATFTGPYNLDGNGYANTGISFTTSKNGWQKDTKATKLGRFPITYSGSSSTYTCDYCYVYYSSEVDYAYVGGACDNGSSCGAWYVYLLYEASDSGWSIGASLSFL